MPSNEITVEEWNELPSPGEINKTLCVLCNTPLEIALEIQKGVHFDCAVQELYTDYNLPTCQKCGNPLTIHDPNPLTDRRPLLCGKCDRLTELSKLKERYRVLYENGTRTV